MRLLELAGLGIFCQLAGLPVQTQADAIGYELGSPGQTPDFSSGASATDSCECRQCCKNTMKGDLSCPKCTDCPAYCSGPSSGCDANSPEWRSGCYGINKFGNGGDCVCSTGEFKNPEVYKLAGRAVGMASGYEVVLVNSMPSPILQGVTAKMRTTVKTNGVFTFPFKITLGQAYHVTVEAVLLNNRPTDAAACDIHNSKGAQASGQWGAQVAKTGKGGVAFGDIWLELACRAVKNPKPLPKATVVHRLAALHAHSDSPDVSKLAPDCQDSPLLMSPSMGMTPSERVETRKDTELPCKRSFTIHPAHKKKDAFYITEVRGTKSVAFTVSASKLVNVCLVPDVVWYSLGYHQATEDKALCPCVGVTECKHASHTLDPKATYLLFAAEHKLHTHYKSYAALVASYKPIKIEVKVAKHFEPAGKMKVVVVGGLFVAVAAVILFSDRGGSKKRQKGYQSVTPGAEMFSRRKK